MMPEVAGTKKADLVELERFLFGNIEPASVEEAENILEELVNAFSKSPKPGSGIF